MSTPEVDVQLQLDVAQPYQLVSMTLKEGISQLTHAVLEIAGAEDLDLEPALAGAATLVLLVDHVEARRWTLRVGSVGFLAVKKGTLRYRVELHAHPWLLGFTNNTRKFQKKTAEQIVGQILGECGVPARWETVRKTPRRNYCVQYHETNLAFVSRLLEFEGIYYTDDPDGVMVLADTSASAPPVPGPSHFELIEAAGALDAAEVGIHAIRRGSKVCSGAATVNDFDWKKPHQSLLQSRAAERDPYLEIYDYPAGFRNVGDGQHLAQIRLEALRAPAKYVEGTGSVPGFAPAHRFGFGADAGAAFAGEYLLVEVAHAYDAPAFAPREAGAAATAGPTVYHNRFRAIPSGVPFRPEVVTPRPTIGGYHTAMVRGPVGSEIHTDASGRFRAQFHWDREAVGTDADSRWLRMVQESASSQFLARVGWEVNVAYIDGDPDRPIGLARNINGVMRPTYAQPARKNVMTIKTRSSPATGGYNEVRLDDTAGAMAFDVRAERDLIGAVRNDRSETIGRNETHLVGTTLQHDVERDQVLAVGADTATTCGGSYQLTVGKNRRRAVGGDEKIDVSKSFNVTVEGNDTETVGSVRLSIVGSVSPPNPAAALKGAVPTPGAAASKAEDGALAGAKGALAGGGGAGDAASGALGGAAGGLQGMVPSPGGMLAGATGGLSQGASLGGLVNTLCQGGIDRNGEARMTRMVGGAYVATALGTVNVSGHDAYTEIIGGAKLTVAATGSINQSVGGPLVLTVGGAVLRKATGPMSYSAKATAIKVGGVARYVSKEKFRVMCGGTIKITAASEIKLASGGLEIKLTPGATTMKGNVKLTSHDKIAITGGKDNVTT